MLWDIFICSYLINNNTKKRFSLNVSTTYSYEEVFNEDNIRLALEKC
ncbi:MAG: hypothetical protein L6U99_10580 [Clostridium sp.]|nr:MAG: hypothetical protein L6U99_10580 [Clostridium sp.]